MRCGRFGWEILCIADAMQKLPGDRRETEGGELKTWYDLRLREDTKARSELLERACTEEIESTDVNTIT